MPRYALLRHSGAPDDPNGSHIDLLLEDGAGCRTWRLPDLPKPNGEAQPATPLPTHRLVWLKPRSCAVSGNRGWAERIRSGHFSGRLPADAGEPVDVELKGDLNGRLQLRDGRCWLSDP